MFNLLIGIIVIVFFTSCASTLQTKPNTPVKVPLWVSEQALLSPFQAVGYSKPNFQGMYIQRVEAITKARTALSEKISSIITNEYYQKIQTDSNSVKKNYNSTITNISQLFLANSYQVDAFIDEKDNLYVLLEIKSTPMLTQILGKNIPNNNIIPKLQTDKFDINKLLNRRCYSQEKLLTLQTKYPMHKNMPLWFYRPHITNTNTSIGIAEKVYSSTLKKQKKIALTTAKTELAKRKKVLMDSIYKLSEIVINDALGQESSQNVHTKSKAIINNTKVKDIWMNPKNCELYLWLEE